MIQFGVSLAGIAMIVALAWGLGFKTRPTLTDEHAARQVVADAMPGFVAVEVALDAAGQGALVRSADRIVLVRPMGDRWVVRSLDHAQVTTADGRLTLRPRETAFAATTLDLGTAAPHWAGLLA